MRKGRVSRSPHWIMSADDATGFGDVVINAYIVPKFDCGVEGAGHDLVGVIAIPVNAIDLGGMRSDGRKGGCSVASVPDMQILVVGARDDLVISTVPLHLGRSGGIVGKLQRCLPAAEVMHEDEAVHTTGCEEIWMVGREIDVCDGPVMGA